MTFKLLERLSSSLGTWTFRYNPIVLESDAPGVSKAVVEDIMTFSLQPKPIKFSRVQTSETMQWGGPTFFLLWGRGS